MKFTFSRSVILAKNVGKIHSTLSHSQNDLVKISDPPDEAIHGEEERQAVLPDLRLLIHHHHRVEEGVDGDGQIPQGVDGAGSREIGRASCRERV